jgi:hypothetical protein
VTDEITLTLPREREFYGIAHLVLGGLAVRLDLTFEALEDLQLALAGVLDRPDAEGDINVKLRVAEGSFQALIGPFDAQHLHASLERRAQDDLTVARLLEAVVDRVEVDERDETAWIELTKSVEVVARR